MDRIARQVRVLDLAAELPVRPRRRHSCRLFLALVIGAVVDGLPFLLFIGIVLFVADLIHAEVIVTSGS